MGDSPTLADFAAYADIGQLQSQFTNVFNFDDFPQVKQWLNNMTQIEGHDDVHVVLAELGDISVEPPSLEKIKNANKRALQTLQQKIDEIKQS